VKIILDECIPKKIKNLIRGHEVSTVPEKGWAGVKNGKLLALVEFEFQVFVTVDRNLSFQQDIKNLKIIVVVLHSASNRFDALKTLMPELLLRLEKAKAGEILHV